MTQAHATPLIGHVAKLANNVLWLLFLVGCVWLVSIAPQMSHARFLADHERAQGVREENQALCEKWGMRAGTSRLSRCVEDVAALRAKDRRETLEELNDF